MRNSFFPKILLTKPLLDYISGILVTEALISESIQNLSCLVGLVGRKFRSVEAVLLKKGGLKVLTAGKNTLRIICLPNNLAL